MSPHDEAGQQTGRQGVRVREPQPMHARSAKLRKRFRLFFAQQFGNQPVPSSVQRKGHFKLLHQFEHKAVPVGGVCDGIESLRHPRLWQHSVAVPFLDVADQAIDRFRNPLRFENAGLPQPVVVYQPRQVYYGPPQVVYAPQPYYVQSGWAPPGFRSGWGKRDHRGNGRWNRDRWDRDRWDRDDDDDDDHRRGRGRGGRD